MYLKITLIIILISCTLYSYSSNTMDMIVSFVTYQERLTYLLVPNLCWSNYAIMTLAKTLNNNGVNMGSALQTNSSEYFLHHIIIVVDLSCPGIAAFLLWASDQKYFRSPYRWLLVEADGRSLDILNDLEVLVDSDVVIAKRISDQQFLFTEVYKVSKNSELIYTKRGVWRATCKNSKTSRTDANQPRQTDVKTEIIIMNYERKRRDINIISANGYDDNQESKERTMTLDKYDSKKDIGNKDVVSAIMLSSNKYDAIEDGGSNIVRTDKYGFVEDFWSKTVLSARRRDLRGHVLTMVNVITDSNETRHHLDDRLNLHQDSITKMSYMVVKICFEMLNATENLIFTHTWGYKDKNGNWQGIVDHLIKGEADLGTLTIFTQERMKYIDYIAMVGSTAVRFVFREPPLALLANIFTLPFTAAVWWAIVICILSCALFLYITSKWEASVGMHPMQLDGSWADVLILIIGAVLQQGCTLEPRYAAGRCVTLLLFLALTILYAAYSANIVVLLRAPSSSVRTLPDLLNSPLKLGASDFEYNRYFFKKLNEPIRKAIYDKKIAPKGKKPNFYSMKEGVEKIRKGLFAFHMESNPGYRLIQETYKEEEKCDLVEIDYINEIDPWVPGQKRSPFKDLFKINFIKIRETGIQSNIHHRLHVPRPRCSGTISTFSSVGITDMYPAIIATLYGMLLSPAVLLLEIMYRRLIRLRKNKM